jgi:hypothetical protein
MIKIYKLMPKPKEVGSFENGILKINGKEYKMSISEVLDRYNGGYYRIGKI